MPREIIPIEGIDNILFKITSAEILSKTNNLKNSHPTGDLFPDYRLDKSISTAVPVYMNNSLSNYERQMRLLSGEPSEIVDIKQKVVNAMHMDPPRANDPQYDRKLKKYNEFWGNVDPYRVIQIDSVRHDIGFVNRVLRRIVFDFTIKSGDFAGKISSKNNLSLPLPISSQLEIRIPDLFYDPNDYASMIRHLKDNEASFLLALGIPKGDIPLISSNDFTITSISYLSTPWRPEA